MIKMCNKLKKENLEFCPLCAIRSDVDIEILWKNWLVLFRKCPKCKSFLATYYHKIMHTEIVDNWGWTFLGKSLKNKKEIVDKFMKTNFYDPWDNAKMKWGHSLTKKEK